jgi:hypothetical protein
MISYFCEMPGPPNQTALGLLGRDLKDACYTHPFGAYGKLEVRNWRMRSKNERRCRFGGTRVTIFGLTGRRLTDSFSTARCKNREGNFPLAIHTTFAFGRVLVMLVAGSALCYRENNDLTS